MYARISKHFSPAALTLSVIAIVLALAGGAIAAQSGKPGPRGPRGKTGKTGPQGPQGLAGTNGKDGTNGTNGTNGEGVTVATASVGECANGGTKFSNASGTGKACNGAPGANGDAGADGNSVEVLEEPDGTGASCPGTGGVVYEVEGSGTENEICNGEPGVLHPGETLPVGATETGAWGFSGVNSGEEVVTSVSFPIPLVERLAGAHVHYVTASQRTTTECPGEYSEPKALSGQLCIYEGVSGHVVGAPRIEKLNLAEGVGGAGANTSGAALVFTTAAAGAYGSGSFAVTGFAPGAGG